MKSVLIGKKIGMSQVFNQENAKLTPVTVLEVSQNVVSRIIENPDGTFVEFAKDSKKKSSKAELGIYKKIKAAPRHSYIVKKEEANGEFEVGQDLDASTFEIGDKVEVKGVTKGKGFSGVMKRWGFKGGQATHGQSDRDRAPGSIGSGTTPGRVVKGKKMPGRMGRENQTIKNLKVMHVDKENNLVAVSGSVPGFKGSYIVIQKSK